MIHSSGISRRKDIDMKYKYTFVAVDFDLNSQVFTQTFDKRLNDEEVSNYRNKVMEVNKGLANVSVRHFERIKE